SAAGDINGDGVSDLLIGAEGHANNTGRSYVVFGDIPPVLVNNSLSLSVGATITLNVTFLAAYDRNHDNNTLMFIPGSVEHGQFEAAGAPGIPLSNFTQQQVASGTIRFVHDGTLVAPRYDITVRSEGIAWVGPLSAKINFIGTPPSYFPAVLPLSSLNGKNGFKLDGEVSGDNSGYSVSSTGDINGDGISDLLIGAPNHASTMGRSYVVFGGSEVGNLGLMALSGLNGSNGFKLDGEVTNDQSGYSVSPAGDINGDRIADLLIGAYTHNNSTGRSYVVFGGSGVSGSSLLALSGLNGSNGFKLDGEVTNDRSGYSVSTVGDINGDGVSDLLIGAYGHASGTGRSYVVFGGLGVGSSSLIALSGLNGSNGFKLDGEALSDVSGYSVSAAGDINNDGVSDLLIGACHRSSWIGRSYVVFGGSNVGGSGLLALSGLNGSNGFKLDGETVNSRSGVSMNAVGDINGDGVSDLLIGADGGYTGSGYTGRSYVVFGGPGVGASGLVALSGLNGSNGFKLDGETENDRSGYSVSTVGDINGDGVSDLLIGAYGHASGTGRSYVVFGGSGVGSSSLVALSGLNGNTGFKLDGETSSDYSGFSVSTAGDINGDGISDLLIGAYGHANLTGRSYVIFGDSAPVLVSNSLSLSVGATINLNATFLAAYDRNHPNSSLVFAPANVTHGYFQSTSQPGIPLINFTQPQLQNNTIQFVHDGSTFAPSYNITVRSDGIAWTGPSPANVSFSLSTPGPTPTPTPTVTPSSTPSPTPTATPTLPPIVLQKNQLALKDGQTVILSNNQLQATEAGFNNSQLVFRVSEVSNGYFSSVPVGNSVKKNLTSFTQGQVQSGGVEFVHAGNQQTPGYVVSVTDGVQSTPPNPANIVFTDAPIIQQITLNITQGETITLTSALLNVTATDGSTPSQVILTVSDLEHAAIKSNLTGASVSNFTLAELQQGVIQLTQDGSPVTPSLIITAEGVKQISSAPTPAFVYFSSQGVYAPRLVNNYLSVVQGQATLL
ncbi:MAG: FG-GAP repeat protein, partial [Proteobacteria bacterium]|nr:FG-GAP repeat protein [Pseudomonadota bacterium]